MNRGSARMSAPSSASVAGFNEAPIHESGKWYVTPSWKQVRAQLQ